MKVLIIGAGNMGKTYAKTFLTSHFVREKDIYLMEKNPLQEDFLKNVPAENIISVPSEILGAADIVILAVKPQDFDALHADIHPYIHEEQIVLSIMAGVKMQSVAGKLRTGKVVRAMPNLPAQIGMGMTVYTCTPSLDRKDLFIIQNLLNATGKSIYVEDEELVDAATAISGSGPAYVYYFMQSIIEKAEQMGFSRSEAELMVNQTFMGAVHLHNRYELTCAEWIARVASKGGTTEAALRSFAEDNLIAGIGNGLEHALRRARELGGTGQK